MAKMSWPELEAFIDEFNLRLDKNLKLDVAGRAVVVSTIVEVMASRGLVEVETETDGVQ